MLRDEKTDGTGKRAIDVSFAGTVDYITAGLDCCTGGLVEAEP
jgi:hypothetical protein